jgi:signal transduction histidine kinase
VENRLFRSESFRLTALFAAMLIGATAVLAAGLYLVVDHAFRHEILLNAREEMAAIRKGYQSEGLGEAVEVVNQRLARSTLSGVIVLEDPRGRKITGNLPPIAVELGARHLTLAVPSGRRRNVFGVGEMIGPNLFAFVGQDLHVLHETQEQTAGVIGWILGMTLLMALGGGLLLSRGVLRRTDAITRTCRSIMDGHLSQRIPSTDTKDELGRLASVINSMLDRINDLMENNRQISSDIAHDLRTPLTRLRHRLELARAEAATTDDYAAAVDGAIAETENILSTFSALLRIGQIEAGVGQKSFQRVDLSAVVNDLVEMYRPAAEDQEHALDVAEIEHAEVHGDRELLSQLIVNLIENAIAHTQAGARIRVSLTHTSREYVLAVADDGPGIPAEEHEKVFRRFYRLERSRTSPGSGLGLSLVAAIAHIHNGQVSVADNKPGLRIAVAFSKSD